MELNFAIRREGGVATINVNANLIREDSCQALLDAVDAVLEQGVKDVVVDIGLAPVINSYGIGRVAECFERVKNQGGHLQISNIPASLAEVFGLTRLDEIFGPPKREAS